MKFWGAEVKHGEPLKVSPGDGMVLHLSQANVGELKKRKGNESVCLFVNVDGKKLVLGTIYTEKLPQLQFDLMFEKDFELSHNWKYGSVFFYGYKADNGVEEDVASSDEESDSSESEQDLPLDHENNGKRESNAKEHKPAEAARKRKSAAGKQKQLPYELLSGSSDDEVDNESNTEEDDDSDAESDESEETPKKAETSQKRPVEPASKTPVTQKKAKVNPRSTDGKKGCVHVDTPYPSRPVGNKAPFAEKKYNPQTPKSRGSHLCTSCNRTFVNDKALDSHSKAKHSGGK